MAAQVPVERLGIEPAARRALHGRRTRVHGRSLREPDGKILWHAQLGSQITNAPQTWMLDGRQYVTVASGDTLWAFYLQ